MADELMLEEIRQALRADFVEHLREAYRSAQQAEHRIFPKERERKSSQGRTVGEAFTLDGFLLSAMGNRWRGVPDERGESGIE